VRGIEELANEVRLLVPTARVLVVHGQLPEGEIEERMLRFVDHEADVLVATTLIENGLDIKRANTLIVDRADRYGLAEMHQLRGRVGRSDARAYAYFLLPTRGQVSDVARRRLRAIEEHADLGAGFRIALRDLEIRGAGNVLGAEQSGHIASVGYDLYCRLLKRAVAELKAGQAGKPLDLEKDLDLEATEVEVVLDVPAYVPDAYVEDVALKIECYRKLAQAQEEGELDRLREELRDRYGPLPEVFENLFRLRALRIRAAGHGVLKVTRQDRVLQLRCRHAGRLQAAVRAHRDALRPIDSHMVYLVMADAEGSDEVQLGFLLAALAPVGEDPAAAAARLDPRALREERRRARGRRRPRASPGG
jgi:transcription-repair coupling factor (superfamily II helicase)